MHVGQNQQLLIWHNVAVLARSARGVEFSPARAHPGNRHVTKHLFTFIRAASRAPLLEMLHLLATAPAADVMVITNPCCFHICHCLNLNCTKSTACYHQYCFCPPVPLCACFYCRVSLLSAAAPVPRPHCHSNQHPFCHAPKVRTALVQSYLMPQQQDLGWQPAAQAPITVISLQKLVTLQVKVGVWVLGQVQSPHTG